MSEQDDGFLNRWSRRKSKAGSTASQDAAETAEREGAAVEDVRVDEVEVDEAEIVAKLPDIESLDETSDFSVFLQRGVPDALRRQALRKLWRINPVFSVLDGMNEYDEDYSIATTLAEGVKTVYQVGKGMVSDDDKSPDAEAVEPEVAEEGGKEQAPVQTEPEEEIESAEPAAEASPESPPPELAVPEVAAIERSEAGDEKLTLPEKEGAKPPSRRSAAARRWGILQG